MGLGKDREEGVDRILGKVKDLVDLDKVLDNVVLVKARMDLDKVLDKMVLVEEIVVLVKARVDLDKVVTRDLVEMEDLKVEMDSDGVQT